MISHWFQKLLRNFLIKRQSIGSCLSFILCGLHKPFRNNDVKEYFNEEQNVLTNVLCRVQQYVSHASVKHNYDWYRHDVTESSN
jgi:hypothetical protein